MGESSCLQFDHNLLNCLSVSKTPVTEILWNLLVVVNLMFAGQFFLNMLDDYLKKKGWLKFKKRDEPEP